MISSKKGKEEWKRKKGNKKLTLGLRAPRNAPDAVFVGLAREEDERAPLDDGRGRLDPADHLGAVHGVLVLADRAVAPHDVDKDLVAHGVGAVAVAQRVTPGHALAGPGAGPVEAHVLDALDACGAALIQEERQGQAVCGALGLGFRVGKGDGASCPQAACEGRAGPVVCVCAVGEEGGRRMGRGEVDEVVALGQGRGWQGACAAVDLGEGPVVEVGGGRRRVGARGGCG